MTNFDSLCYQCKKVLSNIQKTLLWEYGLEIEIDRKPYEPHTNVLIIENSNLGKDLIKNYSICYIRRSEQSFRNKKRRYRCNTLPAKRK